MFKRFARKPKPTHHAEIQEMLLLTLARAEENGRTLTSTELPREMDLGRGSIETQLSSLEQQGLIKDGAPGTLQLTAAGRTRALALLRRHRLTERLFTDVLGLDWARAHEEADKIEHALSPQAEQALASQLGDPETCPHGNPIPSQRQDLAARTSMPLSNCAPLSTATITRIALETPASLQHLATLGLLPDVEIIVENKAPLDGPILVRVGRAHYALGRDLTQRIWVTLQSHTG